MRYVVYIKNGSLWNTVGKTKTFVAALNIARQYSVRYMIREVPKEDADRLY